MVTVRLYHLTLLIIILSCTVGFTKLNFYLIINNLEDKRETNSGSVASVK